MVILVICIENYGKPGQLVSEAEGHPWRVWKLSIAKPSWYPLFFQKFSTDPQHQSLAVY